jgi:hypothetical protein
MLLIILNHLLDELVGIAKQVLLRKMEETMGIVLDLANVRFSGLQLEHIA